MVEQASAEERLSDPERLVTFTDGVFAIIVTILVLEIGVPADLPEEALGEALRDLGPTLLAWVISFLITGMYWVWHRDLFSQVRAVNRDVIWLNLLFLLPCALIPFAAAMLGEYSTEPIALRVYGTVLIVASLMRTALYSYLMKHPSLLWKSPSAQGRRVGTFLALVPIIVYVVAMLIAELAPPASLLLYLGLPLLYFGLISVMRMHPSTRDEAADFS